MIGTLKKISIEPIERELVLRQASVELEHVSPTPLLDAEVLLRHVCHLTRTEVLTGPDIPLSAAQSQTLKELVRRRRTGVPIAYLTGMREFWSMKFQVTTETLIPRPETELLVERALARIPQKTSWTVADLGTGCGVIALALARERPQLRIIATDRSKPALHLARENAKKLGVTNIEFRAGDWLAPLADTKCHMIVSNPPYLSENDPHLLQGDVRFEPRTALVAGPDGLECLRTLVAQASTFLQPRGWVLVEHGYDQAEAILDLAQGVGYDEITHYRDLADHARITEFRVR